MSRKSIAVILAVLIVFSLMLTGCKKSATPPLGNIQEGETTAMIQEAGANPTVVVAEATPVEATPAPATEAAPAATEAAPAATTEATPVATEVVPVATEVATVEATVVVIEPTVAATTQPVVAAAPGKHIVQPGENLFRIALRYGTTVEELAKANGITNVNMISAGQELTIPGGTPGGTTPTPTTPPAPPSGGEKTYVVQPGDNLFRIALKYNYSYYYLAKYNGIAYPYVIYPGRVIRIP
ncbi:MAG TPA: LysM domain-containing protein [Anaerolineae bacterium]|nr:LysM domain-containing protein [Anaerolineae bacterium]HQK14719.1 LysM domain-containing protein [Anaerolineae bacterium]